VLDEKDVQMLMADVTKEQAENKVTKKKVSKKAVGPDVAPNDAMKAALRESAAKMIENGSKMAEKGVEDTDPINDTVETVETVSQPTSLDLGAFAIDADTIRKIRVECYRKGAKRVEIAATYGLTTQQVNEIVMNAAWVAAILGVDPKPVKEPKQRQASPIAPRKGVTLADMLSTLDQQALESIKSLYGCPDDSAAIRLALRVVGRREMVPVMAKLLEENA
jgi:hypothetical protein